MSFGGDLLGGLKDFGNGFLGFGEDLFGMFTGGVGGLSSLVSYLPYVLVGGVALLIITKV